MKLERDMDLIIQILRTVSLSEFKDVYAKPISIEGYDDETVGYHIALLKDAGLVEARVSNSAAGPNYERVFFLGILWEGHEFIDAIQQETVYQRFKKTLSEKVPVYHLKRLRTYS